MKRFSTLFALILFIGAMGLQAQTLTTFGVSPREASNDVDDIFTMAFNGNTNVGVQTQMYLKGTIPSDLGTPALKLTTKPTGSTNTVPTATIDSETGDYYYVFTPDKTGKYVFTFGVAGNETELVVNSAKYVGFGSGATCATCHSEKNNMYQETGHATGLTLKLNGFETDHFASYCVSCHSTGYDTNADNDGFDDFDFTFPDSLQLANWGHPGGHLFDGVADSLAALYPDAMSRGNIQCESCHGPGSGHYGQVGDSKITSMLDSKICAQCHDSGTHHVYPAQWDVSGHANPPGRAEWSGSCARCHTTSGFIAYAAGEEVPAVPGGVEAISCVACHDPHSVANENQIRKVTAVLNNGVEVEAGDQGEGGKGILCMNCHQSRRDAVTYVPVSSGGHFGPHYVPQADMLLGTNVITFGQDLPTSPHATAVENTCVDCHMAPGHVDEDNNVILAGAHSFQVNFPNGSSNVAICEDCHGDVGDDFDVKKYYVNGNADHDGDGTEEGLQDEVHGLMDNLAAMLPHADSVAGWDPHDGVPSDWSFAKKGAAYNLDMVYYDHSYGIHNPAFTVALLKVSIKALEVEEAGPGQIMEIMDIPNDQGYSVGVVWSKFAGEGFGTNPLVKYGVWRIEEMGDGGAKSANFKSFSSSDLKIGDKVQDGHLVYVFSGEVPAANQMTYGFHAATVFNAMPEDTTWHTFRVSAHSLDGTNVEWSNEMSGYSVDNLMPMAPTNLAGQVEGSSIKLAWDEPVDEDFQYFAVYRGESTGFTPNAQNMIAQVSNIEFTDNSLTANKSYYYVVSAFDFSGNESEFSQEISASVTGVEEGGIPTEFELSQNYPNPFNPTTYIKYGIPEAADVNITIYNALGKEVKTLVRKAQDSGFYSVQWDAKDSMGNILPSGIYFYRIQAGDFVDSKKMILLK
ncbi:MAG: T9SS type A sorting domain-containing protein [Melioribacteraceae bacterium]|nr:T9SS type A sorting domain-containing protein [Melioribacteraceae bacterium]